MDILQKIALTGLVEEPEMQAADTNAEVMDTETLEILTETKEESHQEMTIIAQATMLAEMAIATENPPMVELEGAMMTTCVVIQKAALVSIMVRVLDLVHLTVIAELHHHLVVDPPLLVVRLLSQWRSQDTLIVLLAVMVAITVLLGLPEVPLV